MRFCFVAPRYGAEIAAGVEHGCRLLAEQVAERHDVEVLTTTARNPQTWNNEYAEGADKVRGVLVRRFAVSQPHDVSTFGVLSRQLQADARARQDELEWVRRLGPWAPGLLEYLKRQHRTYDALVFFSLHHATTVHGLHVAPERSLLFPYLQLTPALRFALWGELVRLPRALGLFSASERQLLHRYLRCMTADEDVVGIGIEPSQQLMYPRHQQDPADAPVRDDVDPANGDASESPGYLEGRGVPFRRRHRLYGQIALYGGRVEDNNGCEEMLEYFDGAAADGDTMLVLMGVKMMKVPDERNVRHAGILPNRERMAAFEAADVTVSPAADDLLNESLLESMAVGTPVLANAANLAAVDHCRRSGGGLYYANREEFVEALRLMMTSGRLRERLGESGRRYVGSYCRWDAVLGRFERLVGHVRKP